MNHAPLMRRFQRFHNRRKKLKTAFRVHCSDFPKAAHKRLAFYEIHHNVSGVILKEYFPHSNNAGNLVNFRHFPRFPHETVPSGLPVFDTAVPMERRGFSGSIGHILGHIFLDGHTQIQRLIQRDIRNAETALT